jgi:hypothetical protein
MVRFLKILCLFLLMTPAVSGATGPADLQPALKAVTKALGSGSADIVGGYFSQMADLDLPGYTGTYSKAQAGKILSDFLAAHKVSEFSITKQDETGNGGIFTIGLLKSASKLYRVYFIMKEENGKPVIPVFKINEQ